MKRNNVAKTFGIASLCLATAISAFSGITSFATGSVAFAEDAETAAVEDVLTVSEGATASVERRNVYFKANKTAESNAPCLRVSSDVPYEATFNRIFCGNSQFRFAFPNERPEGVATTEFWGDFKFRFTDATDDTNFFDVGYTTHDYGTAVYVGWNGHTVNCYGGTSTGISSAYSRDKITAGSGTNRACFAPAFFGYDPTYSYDTREGKLALTWTDDVLTITANPMRPGDSSDSIAITIAKFDGTYNSTATNTGFVNKSKWGFPKMRFPNGYKVSFSSSYTNANTTDQASDVSFWKIANYDDTYTFGNETIANDNYAQAYDVMQANSDKTLIGWKDANGVLYRTLKAINSTDFANLTPVFLGFNKIKGASVRIDTSEGGQSGLRFITGFNPDEYASAKDYITSFGTLIAYTNKLIRGRLDAVNYASDITAATSVADVQNTKGTFAYTQGGTSYTAYSMALVGLTNFTQSYSARGYIVVTYEDGVTATFYTPYNAENDARSIAQTAYNLKTIGAAEYNAYTDAQKGIVDSYIPEGFVPAE